MLKWYRNIHDKPLDCWALILIHIWMSDLMLNRNMLSNAMAQFHHTSWRSSFNARLIKIGGVSSDDNDYGSLLRDIQWSKARYAGINSNLW